MQLKLGGFVFVLHVLIHLLHLAVFEQDSNVPFVIKFAINICLCYKALICNLPGSGKKTEMWAFTLSFLDYFPAGLCYMQICKLKFINMYM